MLTEAAGGVGAARDGNRHSDQSHAQASVVHQPRDLQIPQSCRADMVSTERFPPHRHPL